MVDWHWSGGVGIRVARPFLKQVLTALKTHPAVRFLSCTTGRYDILADIETASQEKLRAVAEEEFPRIPGVLVCDLFISHETLPGPMIASFVIPELVNGA
jgi:DNA-binding Lrp family transcriptional regulator